jgi:hypothetical protein
MIYTYIQIVTHPGGAVCSRTLIVSNGCVHVQTQQSAARSAHGSLARKFGALC